VQVHLVDGTYELFRYHFALPPHTTADGVPVAATRGVLGTVLQLIQEGATHVGVATDHVIESWRNDRWPGYKTSAGMPPELLAQFPLIEDALEAMGVVVWRMVEFEADDGLAAAAAMAIADPRVDQVLICTPDKDLGQCVTGDRVVQVDRRKQVVLDEAGVIDKFGVPPASIPDYLALVGDSADGYPGLAGWGAKSAAAVLRRYGHLEEIPVLALHWDVEVRGAVKLATVLAEQRELALLFRELARLRLDAPVSASVDELRWTGPTDAFPTWCDRIDATNLAARAAKLATRRAPG
jgi:5'-3' exonuclease